MSCGHTHGNIHSLISVIGVCNRFGLISYAAAQKDGLGVHIIASLRVVGDYAALIKGGSLRNAPDNGLFGDFSAENRLMALLISNMLRTDVSISPAPAFRTIFRTVHTAPTQSSIERPIASLELRVADLTSLHL